MDCGAISQLLGSDPYITQGREYDTDGSTHGMYSRLLITSKKLIVNERRRMDYDEKVNVAGADTVVLQRKKTDARTSRVEG
jgi:hypothetical protein